MSARIGYNCFAKSLTEGPSAALARGKPAATKRVMNRAVSTAAGIKDNATEFLTDVSDAIQTEDVSNKFDTKWVMSELTKTDELGKRGELLFAGQTILTLLVLVPPFDLEILSRLIGLTAVVSGLAIAAAGSKSLGKNLTPLPVPRQEQGSLITKGMYKYMRHPMYTGLILFTTGVAATSSDSTRMLFALGLATLLTFKTEFEEKALIDKYGEEYKKYQARVKRFGFL